MAIYDAGTASLSADGTVTGVGTTWSQPLTLIRVGATMIFNTTPASIVTIAEIISDTEIRVFNDKGFTAPAGTQYSILAHDGITVQGLAQDVAETLRYYQSRETEIAAAVDAFNQFDAGAFQQNVTNVNNQSQQVAIDAAQVASDKSQVSSDKDSAAASASSALADKNAAAASAAEAANSAASLDASNLLRVDRSLSDLTDKPLSRSNLDVYSKGEVDNLIGAGISGYDGFNNIGRVLNISALQTVNPDRAGITVYVSSAFSASEDNNHKGGGFFHSVSRSGLENDYGIVVFPTEPGDYCWHRVGYNNYNAEFWGVVADGSTDNAVAISRAMDYARKKRVIIDFPAGAIHTSEAVVIYSNSGIRGAGSRVEGTVFYKTTNNQFSIFGGISVDAMCILHPQSVWDIPSYVMESFNVHGSVRNCHFRRLGLTLENADLNMPTYGLFMGKAGSPVIEDSSFEGALNGIKAYCAFSGVIARVSLTTFNTKGYAGIDISSYYGGVLYASGTSMDLRNIGVRGYQLGFTLARLQYSTMTNCHAEEIFTKEEGQQAWAFEFINPYGITMTGCATEFVSGGQIRVRGFANPSFGCNLNVNGYVAIDQQNPSVLTPFYWVTSDGSSTNVNFMGCELGRSTNLANLALPAVGGANAKVTYISNTNAPDIQTYDSGVFTRLS